MSRLQLVEVVSHDAVDPLALATRQGGAALADDEAIAAGLGQNELVRLGPARRFLDKHLKGEASDYPAKELAKYKGAVVVIPNNDIPAWWNAKTEAERASLEARINASKPVYPGLPILTPPAPAAPATPAPK